MVMKRLLVVLVFGLLAAAPQAEESTAKPYRIGIRDVLGLVVWNESKLTLDLQVRPDGRITVPLLNDIHVEGMAPEELAAKITQELSAFVNAPSVTVIVRQINSYQVYFLGEVSNQGALAFYRPTRILQGIATAGGLTQFSKKEITLLREVGGVEKRFRIDYKKLIEGDQAQENLYLLPSDTLLFH
jgi:polysaccharide export outer membrane protein